MKKKKTPGKPKGTTQIPNDGRTTKFLSNTNGYPSLHIHAILMRMGLKPKDTVDVCWGKGKIVITKHKNGR